MPIEGHTRRGTYSDPDANNVEERTVTVDPKWQKQEPPKGKFFKFENVGDSVEGILVELFAGEYKGKANKNAKVKLENEKEISFRLSQQLDEYLSPVAPGTVIKIVYTGKKHTGSGGSFKTYDFYTA